MPFPDGFRWGVATSAYQIEGAVREDGRGPSIWDTFTRVPGNVADGTTGDVACDHYHRWPQDVALLAALDIRHYRFSIAWPRVLPEGTGAVNERGLDFYRRLVDALLTHGIRPAATLYHWDLPQALEDRGGWRARSTADAFARYAEVVYRGLGDRVDTWFTHNEPWMTAFIGHYRGVHAPGLRDLRAALAVAHHVLLSHGLAVQAFRALGASGDIGIVLNLFHHEPATDSAADRAATRESDGYTNRWFLDPLFRGRYPEDTERLFGAVVGEPDFVRPGDLRAIAEPIDVLGINYYTRRLMQADAHDELGFSVVDERTTGAPLTDDGTPIHPHGLTEILVRVAREYPAIPLLVTENGAVYRDAVNRDGRVRDLDRVRFLRSHFDAAAAALAQGVDLRGYFVWSFLDNFEWADGYSRRYGVVYVDYPTQRRIPKESAHFLSRVADESRR